MLDVCDPRVIRALLEKYGFHFSKAKGQNFLTQRWVPQRIAQEAGIDRSTGVLEIGPGFGPLTQELCLRAGRVTAIELDTTLRPVLAETVGEFDNLTIHFADAMKMDLPALVQAEFPGLTPAAYRNRHQQSIAEDGAGPRDIPAERDGEPDAEIRAQAHDKKTFPADV